MPFLFLIVLADDCHWVRFPQDRERSGRSWSATRAARGTPCRWFGSLPPHNPTLRGKVVQGLCSERCPWRDTVGVSIPNQVTVPAMSAHSPTAGGVSTLRDESEDL